MLVKLKLKVSLQNNWPKSLQNVCVLKNKERLRSSSRLEINYIWQLNEMHDTDLDTEQENFAVNDIIGITGEI